MFKARWGEWNLASGISLFGAEMGAAATCTWLWTLHCYGKASVVVEIVCNTCPLSALGLWCIILHQQFIHSLEYIYLQEQDSRVHGFSITFWALLSGCCLVTQSCLTLCDPMHCSPTGCSVHGTFPGKNTGVNCHFLLQGIFLTQRSKPGLLHCRWILSLLSHQDIYKSPKDVNKMCDSSFF